MSFEKLRVYQAAELLDTLVLALIAEIPKGHGKDVDQLRRACSSVPYNISEAFGSELGRKQTHLEIARGSSDETRSVLRRLVRDRALTAQAIKRPTTLTHTIAKMLTAWLDSL